MSEEKHPIMLQGTDRSMENCKGGVSLFFFFKKKRGWVGWAGGRKKEIIRFYNPEDFLVLP